MSKPTEELSMYDMDSRQIPDGWDNKTVPDTTMENMEILVNKVNELVRIVNVLTEHNERHDTPSC